MTDRRRDRNRHRERQRRTMAAVDHTNPHTGETFGVVYRRGPVVTDGGERGRAAPSPSEEEGTDDPTMAEVDHESPNGDVAGVWERGLDETPTPTVSDEEDASDGPRATDD